MIVPSMYLAELKKEIALDFPIVYRKSTYLEQDFKRLLKHKHYESEVQLHFYLSKYKNNWIIRIEEQKKGAMVSFFTYYFKDDKMIGICPGVDDRYLSFFTPQFFRSYKACMHPDTVSTIDFARSFANENLVAEEIKLAYCATGICKVFCSTPHGFMLGTCDEIKKFYKMNVFVTHEMLRGNFDEKAIMVNEMLEMYLKDAGNLD